MATFFNGVVSIRVIWTWQKQLCSGLPLHLFPLACTWLPCTGMESGYFTLFFPWASLVPSPVIKQGGSRAKSKEVEKSHLRKEADKKYNSLSLLLHRELQKCA